MRKIESIMLKAGQTPMGTLTMATHPPRKTVSVRVIRERDYRLLLAVARKAEEQYARMCGTLKGGVSGYMVEPQLEHAIDCLNEPQKHQRRGCSDEA